MNSKWFAYGMTHEQADLNLLLFPFAGGCPSVFVQWKRLLSAKVNVYPVLYPFREARRSEQLPDTVQQLAQSLAAENEAVFSGKYAIFAHCAGASVAYETILAAKQLYGTEPEWLIVSGAEPPEYSLESLRYLADASPAEFLDYLISRGFAEESVRDNPAFLSYYLPIISADFRMLFSYRMTAAPPLHCPIFRFRGDTDKVIDPARLAAWQHYTEGTCTEQVFSGGHYYFTADPAPVCSSINRILEQGGKANG